MKNKKDNLGNSYEQINSEYNGTGNLNEEKLTQDIEAINKEIAGKTAYMQKIKDVDKKAEILKDIKKLEVRKNNLEGYSKYGSQINKIREYKEKLNKKMIEKEKEKKSLSKEIDYLKKVKERLEKESKELLNRISGDTSKTLTEPEYQKILAEKLEKDSKIETVNKKIEEKTKKMQGLATKVVELNGKIGKCDLAWRTLFTNKDWDEINKRAVEDKRYTRTVEKGEKLSDLKPKSNNKEKSESVSKENESSESKIEKTDKNKERIFKDEENEEKSMTVIEKDPWFKRFGNFMKNNFKKVFAKKQVTEKSKQEIKESVEEIKENIDKVDIKPVKEDKFIQGLRAFVDQEYKEDITNKKEQEYILKHKKVQSKSKQPTDKEIGE